ncbi:TIGR03089 family protein [Cellulomonas humilata]|uniref:Uncharacterized protein (TIGR03089 family) n=1 Tax=Cellulomonas humilata TaxID=144055 RepID=A0ABU0EDB5_9CELL|nr:TIGR03089 family protein [Cellulomonas humilata]MDQ0373260.1 uncharacterized protein (TIGR03089 family) [Cellulomonas humilata]
MPPTTTADLLRLLTRDPGRPRLTWYGDGGERVELSGAVLENWVNKTANLLVEEFDAEPGTRVRLDLPGHWRTVIWALATWRVGACVSLVPEEADVVVTDRPDASPGATELVAVSLPALARRYDGTLPAGAVDAATAVMTYADALGWTAPAQPDETALVGAETVTHADLLTTAVTPEPGRVLRVAPDRTGTVDLLAVLGTLAGDGSLVLVSPEVGRVLLDDPDRRARLVGTERVTTDLLGTAG